MYGVMVFSALVLLVLLVDPTTSTGGECRDRYATVTCEKRRNQGRCQYGEIYGNMYKEYCAKTCG